MIKFETINGTLCLMLEKAVPLTEDAKFPCVVRLIQDESPMGRYNTHGLIVSCFEPIIATGSYNGRTASKEEPFSGWDINRYEILGYPVVPNSAEWALYRMMQGNYVIHEGLNPCNIHCEMVTWLDSPESKHFTMQPLDKWLLYCPFNNGWQLYEPKPEPKVQVGDYVRTANGDGKVIEVPLTMPEVILTNRQRGSFHADEISVISPAEVRVKITLEGTVEKRKDNRFAFNLVSGITNSAIHYDMLDPATAAMVRELIEKQEGENK